MRPALVHKARQAQGHCDAAAAIATAARAFVRRQDLAAAVEGGGGAAACAAPPLARPPALDVPLPANCTLVSPGQRVERGTAWVGAGLGPPSGLCPPSLAACGVDTEPTGYPCFGLCHRGAWPPPPTPAGRPPASSQRPPSPPWPGCSPPAPPPRSTCCVPTCARRRRRRVRAGGVRAPAAETV